MGISYCRSAKLQHDMLLPQLLVAPIKDAAPDTRHFLNRVEMIPTAGFEPGVTPLGVFRPPAPQDGQMRAAQLHQFAGVYAE